MQEQTNAMAARALRALDRVDTYPPDIKQLIHEFGSEIVEPIFTIVKKPSHIRSIIHTCWMGARQPAQRNRLGRTRSPVLDNLDWIMIQAGAEITAATLLRVLAQHNMVIVPREPSTVMIEASKNEVTYLDERVTKTEKHRRRLKAAVDASTKRLWPHI